MNNLRIAILPLRVAVMFTVAGSLITRTAHVATAGRVVRSRGKFAVRDHPALALAETPLAGKGNSDSRDFMRLFRFSGRRRPANAAHAWERLRKRMQAEGLKELSPLMYGYFAPPWTLPFLRRNEVMIRIEKRT